MKWVNNLSKRLEDDGINKVKAMKIPVVHHILSLSSFLFHSLSYRPLLSYNTNRPLPFLWSRSDCFPRSLHTRDARENNLESTLVVTATPTPSTTPTEDIFPLAFPPSSSLPRSLYELSGPKLWPAREPVNCRQRRRFNRRSSAGDVREALSRRISSRLPASVDSHLLEVFAPSFFISGENYFDSKSGSSGSSTHTVIKLRGLFLKYSIQYAGIKLIWIINESTKNMLHFNCTSLRYTL